MTKKSEHTFSNEKYSKELLIMPQILKELKNENIDLTDVSDELDFTIEYSDDGKTFSTDGDLDFGFDPHEQKLIENNFISLSGADASGSIYAFYLYDKTLPIERQPIVFFGSEGEFGVCAANLNEWLRLISTGGKIQQLTQLELYMDIPCSEGISDNLMRYRQWLREKGLSPFEEKLEEKSVNDELAIEYSANIIDEAGLLYTKSLIERYPFLNS